MIHLRQFWVDITMKQWQYCTAACFWHSAFLYSSMFFFFFFYLSVLLGGLDHVHVHIVHQVCHLWHVLDDLVWLSRCISLSEGNKKRKIRLFWINTVMQKEWQWRIIPVSLAVMVNYWCDAIAQWNYNSPACYLLPIWKQISHFLPPVIAPHVASKGVESMQSL